MAQENAETLRTGLDAFNRRDKAAVPGPYNGYDGLRRWRDDLFEVIAEGRIEVEELRDVHPADAVAAQVRLRGRAAHTGLDVDVPFAIAIFLRDKRIYRTRSYTDRAEALKAAGLPE